MKKLYWWLCGRIGYAIVFRDHYDTKTFTLKKKNGYITLFKHIGKRDDIGSRRVKELFTIKIR